MDKFITKKVIKGKGYVYFQFNGTSKSIGKKMSSISDLQTAYLNFFDIVSLKESAKIDKSIQREFFHINFNKFEDAHYWYKCLSQTYAFRRELESFNLWFAILFTYNSARSEGSKMTEQEVAKIIKKNKKPTIRKPEMVEIFNADKVWKYASRKSFHINSRTIKYLHKMLFENTPYKYQAGVWKDESNVAPGNQPTVPPNKVNSSILNLVKWYQSELKKKNLYPPLLAIQFYAQFEKIHPFSDGNGRVGRIIFNSILNKFSYPPMVFFTENHKSHCSTLTKYLNGQKKAFHQHVYRQFIASYEKMRHLSMPHLRRYKSLKLKN